MGDLNELTNKSEVRRKKKTLEVSSAGSRVEPTSFVRVFKVSHTLSTLSVSSTLIAVPYIL
jgi:hypothetical protein